jgi:hypothetical protein
MLDLSPQYIFALLISSAVFATILAFLEESFGKKSKEKQGEKTGWLPLPGKYAKKKLLETWLFYFVAWFILNIIIDIAFYLFNIV